MSEKERLAEAAALLLERKQKMDEVHAIDRKIEMLVLGVSTAEKRKKPVYNGRDWERVLRAGV